LILKYRGELDASGGGVVGSAGLRCGHVLSLRGLVVSIDLAWDGTMRCPVPPDPGFPESFGHSSVSAKGDFLQVHPAGALTPGFLRRARWHWTLR
jgi:hypothetical protein